MISSLSSCYRGLWSDIENRLIPDPKSGYLDRFRAGPVLFELPVALCVTLAEGVNQAFGSLSAYFVKPEEYPNPNQDFSSVLRDYREWNKIETIEDKITLGHGRKNFLWGIASDTYQDSGLENCPGEQWADWEKKILPPNNRSGKSADFFTLYQTEKGRKKITDALHQLGVNSYRFSIKWSHIERECGEWNEHMLNIYVAFCKHLRDEGIMPMITLHHFSEPIWFHEAGSFENEENIPKFVRFCERVCGVLTQEYQGAPLVSHFCTINEPAIDAFSRFVRGVFSPGLVCDFTRAVRFLQGAFKAHRAVYDCLKNNGLKKELKIGITHQYLRFSAGCFLLEPITSTLTRLVNEVSMRYFETGVFEFKMPFLYIRDETMPEFKTDFIGVQYYVRPRIGSIWGAPRTQMPFEEDPEGLCEAIEESFRACKVPVIVTENGVSTHDNVQRKRYIQRSLYGASRAEENIGKENLLGYHYWSFPDNLEWNMGMRPQAFGAFNRDLHLKEGSSVYARIILLWKSSLPKLLQGKEKAE